MFIRHYGSVLSERGAQGAEISLFFARRTRTAVVFRGCFDRSQAEIRGRSSVIRSPDGQNSREILLD
jgi:hypothetical protein